MFNPTPEQSAAIAARGDILVSAAAGSGKTAVLTERVTRELADEEHPVDANRLLIVTFTNAAASELRARISKRVAEEARRTGSRRLERQKLLIPGAKICTIDSFCIDFVRRNFANPRVAVDPNFRIADEGEIEDAKNRAFKAVFSECYAAGGPGFNAMMNHIARGETTSLRDCVSEVWDYTRCLPFPATWLRRLGDRYRDGGSGYYGGFYRGVERKLRLAAGEVEYALRLAEEQNSARCADVLRSVLRRAEELISAARARDWDAVRAGLAEYKAGSLPNKKTLSPELQDAATGSKEGFKKTVDSLKKNVFNRSLDEARAMTAATGEAVEALAEFTVRFNAAFEESLRRSGAATFDMVERMALNLLCEEGEDGEPVRLASADRLYDEFDEVLVDEYQDTNALQDALFRMLASSSGNFFTVGDVKQSIYRFRHTTPRNFIRRRENMPECRGEGGGYVLLHGNFRSSPEICDFVNFTFSRLMYRSTAGVDYGEGEELRASASFPENRAGGGVEFHVLDGGSGPDELSVTEAGYIARYIRDTVEGGATVALPGGTRRARYGDFAVLMQSLAGRVKDYAEALRKVGVPVAADSKDYFGCEEVSLALSLLRAVDDPEDGVSLLAALRSPLFGFSDDRLAELRAKYRAKSLTGTLAAASGEPDCAEVFARLSEWRRAAVTERPAELITRIFDETGLPVLVGTWENGERRRENLFRLINMADAFSARGRAGSLTLFLREVSRAEAAGKISATGSAGGDAVRIMSVHSAKGLQFPFCIVAGCYVEFNRAEKRSLIAEDEDLGVGARYVDPETRVVSDTISHRAILDAVAEKDTAEKIRLLYVAMTRAEYKLDIILTDKKPRERYRESLRHAANFTPERVLAGNSFADWLWPVALLDEGLKPLFAARYGGEGAEGGGDAAPSEPAGAGNIVTNTAGPVGEDTASGESVGSVNTAPSEVAGAGNTASTSEKIGGGNIVAVASEPARDESTVSANTVGLADEGIAPSEYGPARGGGEPPAPNTAISPRARFAVYKPLDDAPSAAERDAAPDRELIGRMRENFAFRYPYAAEVAAPSKLSVTEITERGVREDLSFTARPAFVSAGGLTPAERGTAAHKFLRYCRLTEARRDIAGEIERLAEYEFLSEAEAASLDRDALTRFLLSPQCERLISARRLYREYPFVVPYRVEGAGADSVVQGVADVVAVSGDGIFLLDYKTDHAPAGEIAERYRAQLEFYADAVSRIFSLPVTEKGLYALSIGEYIPV